MRLHWQADLIVPRTLAGDRRSNQDTADAADCTSPATPPASGGGGGDRLAFHKQSAAAAMRSPWQALRSLFARVGSDPYYASYERSLGNIKAEVDRVQVRPHGLQWDHS